MENKIELFEMAGHAVPIESNRNDPDSIMVNITEMCNAFGRIPAEFLRLKSTIAMIDRLHAMGKNHSMIIQTRSGSKDKFASGGGGTWVCRELAYECARWCSMELAIQLNIAFDVLLKRTRQLPAAQTSHNDLMPYIIELSKSNRELIELVVKSNHDLFESMKQLMTQFSGFPESNKSKPENIIKIKSIGNGLKTIRYFSDYCKSNGVDVGMKTIGKMLRIWGFLTMTRRLKLTTRALNSGYFVYGMRPNGGHNRTYDRVLLTKTGEIYFFDRFSKLDYHGT
jgi:hypothetical protein